MKKVVILGAGPVANLQAVLLTTLFSEVPLEVYGEVDTSDRPYTVDAKTVAHIVKTLVTIANQHKADAAGSVLDVETIVLLQKIDRTIAFLEKHFPATKTSSEITTLCRRHARKMAADYQQQATYYANTVDSEGMLHAVMHKCEMLFAAESDASVVRANLFGEPHQLHAPDLCYKIQIQLSHVAKKRITPKMQHQGSIVYQWDSASDQSATLTLYVNRETYEEYRQRKQQGDRLLELPVALHAFVKKEMEDATGKILSDWQIFKKRVTNQLQRSHSHAPKIVITAQPIYLHPANERDKKVKHTRVCLIGRAASGLLLDEGNINLGWMNAAEKASAYYAARLECLGKGKKITDSLTENVFVQVDADVQKWQNFFDKKQPASVKLYANPIPLAKEMGYEDLMDLRLLTEKVPYFSPDNKQALNKYAAWINEADIMLMTLREITSNKDVLETVRMKDASKRKQLVDQLASTQDVKERKKIKKHKDYLQTQTQYERFLDISHTLFRETFDPMIAAEQKLATCQRLWSLSKELYEELQPLTLRCGELLRATTTVIQYEAACQKFDAVVNTLIKPEHADLKQKLIDLKEKVLDEIPCEDKRARFMLEDFTQMTNRLVQGKLTASGFKAELRKLQSHLFGSPPLSGVLSTCIGVVLGAIAGLVVGIVLLPAVGPVGMAVSVAAGATVAGIYAGLFHRKASHERYAAHCHDTLASLGIGEELLSAKGTLQALTVSPKIAPR